MENLSRKFWPYILLLLLVALLQMKFLFGQGNWRQVESLRAQVLAQKIENEALLKRNRALAAEVKDLKSGVDAIEERARNEMGMIKSGETFYRVIDTEKNKSEPVAETKQEP